MIWQNGYDKGHWEAMQDKARTLRNLEAGLTAWLASTECATSMTPIDPDELFEYWATPRELATGFHDFYLDWLDKNDPQR